MKSINSMIQCLTEEHPYQRTVVGVLVAVAIEEMIFVFAMYIDSDTH